MSLTVITRTIAAFVLAFAWPPGVVAKDVPSQPVPVPAEDAPVALLVDITSGQVLHARNAERRIIPASMTKTMTAFVAFELMAQGKLRPEQNLLVSEEIFEEWNGTGSTMWLDPKTPVSVDDLLTGILAVSANDGSVLLAEGMTGSVRGWTDLMNAKARELEMTASHFNTPNGWPDEGKTFTTAHDLVKLSRAIITRHPQRFARYFGVERFTWNGITQSNYDPLLGAVEGSDGLKTGYTREAGFSFLGTAKQGGQRLVLVLAGTDSVPARAKMAREYIQWGFDTFDRRELFKKGQLAGSARVQGGSERSVGLVTDRVVFVNVPKDRAAELSASVQYDGPIRAPIKAGDRVGTLEVNVPGMEPARVPLLAQDSVARAGFFDRLSNGFLGWFS